MKQKFFIDMDDTLTYSSMAFCEVYNERYKSYPNFKIANYLKNNSWNFEEQCPYLNNDSGKVAEIFESDEFFNYLRPHYFAHEVLEKWKDKYDYYLVSIGTFGNLERKLKYVKRYFPIIKNLILLSTEELKMNKSIVNMKGEEFKPSILLDDHQSNLMSSDADIRILYKSMGNKPWNQDWKGLSCKDWTEVDKCLERYCYESR